MLALRSRVSLLGFLCLLFAYRGNVFAGNSEHPQAEELKPNAGKVWRVANKCAVNALYIMLRLHGREIHYEDLEARLPVGPKGCSLQELRNGATHFGLKTRIVKLTPEDLRQCRLPIIAHFEEEKEITGHYVVLAVVSPSGVEFIDGTSGIISTLPTHQFALNWSGYALVAEERPLWHLLFPLAFLLGVGAICLAIYGRLRERRNLMHETIART